VKEQEGILTLIFVTAVSDLIAPDFNDGDCEGRLFAAGVSDQDGLVKAAGENEHGGLAYVVERLSCPIFSRTSTWR
jgi:hypothetical protein